MKMLNLSMFVCMSNVYLSIAYMICVLLLCFKNFEFRSKKKRFFYNGKTNSMTFCVIDQMSINPPFTSMQLK